MIKKLKLSNKIKMIRNSRPLTVACIMGMLLIGSTSVQAQESKLSVKTNGLYWLASLSPNIGVEYAVAPRYSVLATTAYNNWGSFFGKMRHQLLTGEVRYWPRGVYSQDVYFYGAHLLYVHYIGAFDFMGGNRYHGNAFGVGVSAGYSFSLGVDGLSLEVEIGAGYVYSPYDRYVEVSADGAKEWVAHTNGNYFGPTKLGLTLSYRLPW
jgi:hypothetical protein